jgi:poly-gamma-glutamate capsule biosynthesis protein CapA/YwtB (metallophosphatase superfamily)
MMRRVLVGTVALAALTGCTAAQISPQPTPDVPTTAAASPSGTASPSTTPVPTATPRPTPTTPAATQPLVLAVHATRTVADVPTGVARHLVRRSAAEDALSVRWAALEQPGGGRAEVRTATSATAAEDLLDRVREDDGLVAVVPASAVDATVRVLTVGGKHPLREPARYPLETAATERPGEVTTMTIVGDVMLGRRVAQVSGDDPIRTLRPTAKRLASAEITAGNLESTLSDDGSPTQGGDSFHADPVVISGLELAGFDLVSLANNHVGDYGQRALRQTLAELRDADLPYVGAGRDLDEARKPVVITRDGVRVGFLGTESIGETPAAAADRGGTNRLNMPPRTGPLNERQLDRITTDIEKLSGQVDVVVVIPHWGTQYTHLPEASQRRAAKAFAEAGADLVIGGHPHWVQGWEVMGDTVVVHSLGNFVFDMDFQTKTMEGVFVDVVLWGEEVKAVEPVPYELNSRFVPRVVKGDKAAEILDDVWSTSRGPYEEP